MIMPPQASIPNTAPAAWSASRLSTRMWIARAMGARAFSRPNSAAAPRPCASPSAPPYRHTIAATLNGRKPRPSNCGPARTALNRPSPVTSAGASMIGLRSCRPPCQSASRRTNGATIHNR